MTTHSEVRRYDGKGNLLGVYDVKQVGKMFWTSFYREFSEYSIGSMDEDSGVKMKCKSKWQGVLCNKEFLAKRKHSKYCSPLCKGRAASKYYQRAVPRTVKCEICTSSFKSTRSNPKYCGKECRDVATLYRSRRQDAKAKANLAQRKLEIIERKKKVLRQEHSASHQGSEAGQTHLVQAI
jgi:hypothetical protein